MTEKGTAAVERGHDEWMRTTTGEVVVDGE